MKTANLYSLVLVSLVVGAFPVRATQSLSVSVPGGIEGTVVNAGTGNPEAGVTVAGPARPGNRSLQEMLASRPQAITDAEGRFTLQGLQPGPVEVSFERVGFPNESRLYTISSGQVVRVAPVALPRFGVIAGRVLKTDGSPAVSLSVSLYSYRMSNGRLEM